MPRTLDLTAVEQASIIMPDGNEYLVHSSQTSTMEDITRLQKATERLHEKFSELDGDDDATTAKQYDLTIEMLSMFFVDEVSEDVLRSVPPGKMQELLDFLTAVLKIES